MQAQDSADLTRVGPATMMGRLMRQYWLPAAMSRELRTDGAASIGRFGEAHEIAAAAAPLASDRGGFFVGATLDVNGGSYVR